MKTLADGSILISGRRFSPEQIDAMGKLIAENPELNRSRLALKACERFEWHNAAGAPKHMSMKLVMLRFHRAGLIELPPPQPLFANPPARSRLAVDVSATRFEPIAQRVDRLGPLTIKIVRSSNRKASLRWSAFMRAHHYLGYDRVGGAQLRYQVECEQGLLALLAFGSAAWKCRARDQHIGWDAPQRERALHKIVNNTRFLILPWVNSANLASKILGLMAARLPRDWQQLYGYPPLLLETFVDGQRFRGHCYRAANWIHVGRTTGRGKYDRDHKGLSSIKSIWIYPLAKRALQSLRMDPS